MESSARATNEADRTAAIVSVFGASVAYLLNEEERAIRSGMIRWPGAISTGVQRSGGAGGGRRDAAEGETEKMQSVAA
jgi:hypothetical protein